jgi:hypothetical protein
MIIHTYCGASHTKLLTSDAAAADPAGSWRRTAKQQQQQQTRPQLLIRHCCVPNAACNIRSAHWLRHALGCLHETAVSATVNKNTDNCLAALATLPWNYCSMMLHICCLLSHNAHLIKINSNKPYSCKTTNSISQMRTPNTPVTVPYMLLRQSATRHQAPAIHCQPQTHKDVPQTT